MICTIRIPEIVQARIDSAAGGGKRSEWILEACRMRLDGDTSVAEEAGGFSVVGSIPAPLSTKPDMQVPRDICAGTVAIESKPFEPEEPAIRVCGFRAYNEVDGDTYTCGLPQHNPKRPHGNWIKV